MKRKIGKVIRVILAALGVLIVIGVGAIWMQNQKPQIEMGLEDGKLKEIPNKDNSVSTQTSLEGKKIEALPLKGTVEETKKALLSAMETYGGIDVVEEDDNYIYAIATTGTMKFCDDIEIYIDVEAGVVQYRSASRAGYSDMGLNRLRYDALGEIYLAWH